MVEEKNKIGFGIALGGVNLTQKALFAKHMSVMIKAGVTITEALTIASQSAQGKFKKTLGQVSKSVQAGNSLSESFTRYPRIFPELFVSATRAGETSGTLVENLENVAEQLEKEKELTSKIKGAMLYPTIVLVATFGLGMALSFWVLPKITPLFEGLRIDLPFTTQLLISFSNFVQESGLWLFLGILLFIGFMVWFLKQDIVKPATHRIFLKIPIIKNIVINANLSRFCRTLGTLLRSGLTIGEALEITSKTVGNYYYQKSTKKVAASIAKGTKLSDNLSVYENLFPIVVTRMIRVGEESGKLEDTLLYLAGFYEAEVDTAVKTLSTAIEPMLLIIIGLIVGFLALSIITPIYDITGNIQR